MSCYGRPMNLTRRLLLTNDDGIDAPGPRRPRAGVGFGARRSSPCSGHSRGAVIRSRRTPVPIERWGRCPGRRHPGRLRPGGVASSGRPGRLGHLVDYCRGQPVADVHHSGTVAAWSERVHAWCPGDRRIAARPTLRHRPGTRCEVDAGPRDTPRPADAARDVLERQPPGRRAGVSRSRRSSSPRSTRRRIRSPIGWATECGRCPGVTPTVPDGRVGTSTSALAAGLRSRSCI